MNSKILSFSLVVCVISIIWVPEAWAFSDPIVNKINAASLQMVRIGKGVVGASTVCAIFLLGLGQPQWRWFLYILIAGICLTASGTIIDWINS